METKSMKDLFNVVNQNSITEEVVNKTAEYNAVRMRRSIVEDSIRSLCKPNCGEIFVTIGGSYAIYCQTQGFTRTPHDYDFVVQGDTDQLLHIKRTLGILSNLTTIAEEKRVHSYGECFPLRNLMDKQVDLLFDFRDDKYTQKGDVFENLLDIKDIKETWNRQAKARGAEPRQKDVDDISFIDWWLHKEDAVDLPF